MNIISGSYFVDFHPCTRCLCLHHSRQVRAKNVGKCRDKALPCLITVHSHPTNRTLIRQGSALSLRYPDGYGVSTDQLAKAKNLIPVVSVSTY